jgi:hypothetical protein
MPTATARIARMQLDKVAGTARQINVAIPKGASAKDFSAIVGKIRGWTACPACIASGGCRIIFEEDFSDILHLNLDTGKVINR